ncbi:MgtC/SapB family protein [Adhaeretor mobilis]|uniref:Putative Mg(2+) transport ATPase n=1 Tax=Adhaeretor mobilis TaxID=1930276 RepID=A0A517MXF1_9BACT|nr:MgtC/SapB family protein [Adhaeretor mobilis]QDS99487.1 putative Mg(2+) transport ATPase [Adhaeretor mobilis]
MSDIDFTAISMRIVCAAACGGVLGWEREARDKSAGLRTNMLVAIGAATATIAALDLYASLPGEAPGGISSDPIRIISGVIGGLGFLGAGAIMQSRGRVEGMTTAATIWVVGGIGVACGLGNYALALPVVIIALVVLFAIGKFAHSQLAPESLQKDDT